MEEKLMNAEAVANLMAIHPRTLRQIAAEDETFPKPIKFGERMTRWRYSEIIQWLDSKSNA